MRTQAPEPQIAIPAPPLPPVLLSSRLVVTGILAAGLAPFCLAWVFFFAIW